MNLVTRISPMNRKLTLAIALSLPLAFSACGALSNLFGTASSTSTAKTTSSSSSTHKETLLVNGQPVDANDPDEPDDVPAAKPKKSSKSAPAASNKKALKATCHKNSECESEICWVGSGDIGYCTNMCDDDFGCESFWKCIKPGNAPQHICVQPD